jgi:isopenicillin N synthase-like dioxygenase
VSILPIVDIAALASTRGTLAARAEVASHLDDAARSHGFSCAINHGVDAALIDRLVCNIGDMLDSMTGGRYRPSRARMATT